ncbi:hypothetical protein [Limimaricola sp. AA108-03]|uniref:hypothetical protein n=1 Tax=Limimaricola sp. AA108-03 TaxID=3425945 RepID=UPI003D787F63
MINVFVGAGTGTVGFVFEAVSGVIVFIVIGVAWEGAPVLAFYKHLSAGEVNDGPFLTLTGCYNAAPQLPEPIICSPAQHRLNKKAIFADRTYFRQASAISV